jgi:regulatory protein
MRIKAIRQTGNHEKLDLLFEDDSKLRIAATVVPDLGLYASMEVDAALLAKIQAANEQAMARLRAVRIVAASNVSRKELQRRLVQKGQTPESAEEATAWLSELGAVDDEKTARLLVQRAAAKGYGRARIRQELQLKGIPRELWEEALATLPEPDGAIDRYLQQKLRGASPDQKMKKKLTDALYRRGHRWSDIQAAWRRYGETLEDEAEESDEWQQWE